jgi:hypothetical protein
MLPVISRETGRVVLLSESFRFILFLEGMKDENEYMAE